MFCCGKYGQLQLGLRHAFMLHSSPISTISMFIQKLPLCVIVNVYLAENEINKV